MADSHIPFGAIATAALAEAPNAFRMPTDALDLYVVRSFLTADECAAIIGLIDRDAVPSQTLGSLEDPEFRTSHTCHLDRQHPVVAAIEQRIADLLGIPPEYGEPMQGQRYTVGQQFKAHHDYFHREEEYFERVMAEGGQRTWTAMAFLNHVEAGGATTFPRTAIRIVPTPGNLLTWNNLGLLGEPNPETMHQAQPVERGVKYVVTKWFRERPWGRSSEAAAA
ncbi:MAG: 2OG-Fe(II) oxygenase [Allosphingosinicella sp.]|uniref:2OG-Fe(II) oxygenase n=1 Tax=Allosphingosinicella sp. TaxID=2823234 RepID=UPI00395D9C6A